MLQTWLGSLIRLIFMDEEGTTDAVIHTADMNIAIPFSVSNEWLDACCVDAKLCGNAKNTPLRAW